LTGSDYFISSLFRKPGELVRCILLLLTDLTEDDIEQMIVGVVPLTDLDVEIDEVNNIDTTENNGADDLDLNPSDNNQDINVSKNLFGSSTPGKHSSLSYQKYKHRSENTIKMADSRWEEERKRQLQMLKEFDSVRQNGYLYLKKENLNRLSAAPSYQQLVEI